jgi:hypothetical protein
MTLKGFLKDFSFTQLLNLVNLANKSGALYIERPGISCRAVFHNGKLTHFETSGEKPSLLKTITDHQLITGAQHRLLHERLAGQNDQEIGIYLVNAGYATLDQILNVLEKEYASQLRPLFSWTDGFFRFEACELPPEERIPVRLNLENLIVEGARELEEIEELRSEIPSLEMTLKFTERPGTDLSRINLNSTEWRVISYVNPKNSIQQIAATTKLDEVEIRRVVYTLLQAGLVEIVRPGGQPVALPGASLPVNKPTENRPLIKRLIDRIRSI